MTPSACRVVACVTVAALTWTLGGCAFPVVPISVFPNELAIVQGEQGTITLKTGAPDCGSTNPLPCPDVTGREFDYVLQQVPAGVSYTFDRSLQSPATPGLVRIIFEVAENATPSVYEIAIHVVLDSRSLGVEDFELRVVPTSLEGTAAPVSIAASSSVSVAALADGTVRTWGENVVGALGLGDHTRRTLPTAVPDLVEVRAVAAGAYHALALTDDGHVWGWGRNDRAQLGRLPQTADESFLRPVVIAGVQDVEAVAAGRYHSLALDATGIVWTWGDYGFDPGVQDTPPTRVPELPRIRAIAAGHWESFAVGVDGAVWRWVFIPSGLIHPQQVAGLSDIQAVVAEGESFFAIDGSGNVWAWGDNSLGILGDGTITSREQPARIQGLSNVASISVGSQLAIAVTQTGTVWQWGDRRTPSPVALTGVRAVAAGSDHGLALLDCGALWSWGGNQHGELGDGTTEPHDLPLPVPGIGDDDTCARVGLRVALSNTPIAVDPIRAQPGALERAGAEYFGTFDRGATITLMADAELQATGSVGIQRWTFDHWALDCAGTDPSTTLVLDGSKRCAAVYRDASPALSLLTIVSDGGTVTSSGGGLGGPGSITCPVQCNAVFETGATVELTAHNESGFGFTAWAADCTGTAPATTVTMDGEKTCRALFRPFHLAITVTGSGTVTVVDTGLCTGACSFEPKRAQPTLFATPALGWRFDGWGGDCSGSGSTTTIPLIGDRACTAAFSRDPNFFFLTMIVEGSGSVSSFPPGIECSSTASCVLLLPAGRAFDVVATETGPYMLAGWFDDCAAGALPINPVLIDRDKTCRVRFVTRPAFPVAGMTWEPVSPRVGEITTFHSDSCWFDPVTNTCRAGITGYFWDFEDDATFEASGDAFAASVTQYAFQAAGSHDVRLRVEGGSPLLVDDDVEIVNVQEATAPLFSLTVDKSGSGHGTVSTRPAGLFRCHDSCTSVALLLESGPLVTLVAVPDSESLFAGWTGCDSVSPDGSQCTVTMVDADRIVTANFVPIVTGFTLTVVITAPPGSPGTIVGSSSGNMITCLASGGPGSVCSQTFPPGSTVQVRPGAGEAGAHFSGWSSGCDSIVGSRCNVTLNSHRTVTATFVP